MLHAPVVSESVEVSRRLGESHRCICGLTFWHDSAPILDDTSALRCTINGCRLGTSDSVCKLAHGNDRSLRCETCTG